MMRREKAFTLIELLVVIAVIALLMAILMPALQRVKRQAKAVICMTRLRQWSLWFPMYTADNDDKFFTKKHPTNKHWYEVMRPYYKDFDDVLLCPMAAKHKGGDTYSTGNTFSAWAVNMAAGSRSPRYLYGSYTLNSAVRNDMRHRGSSHGFWKTTLVKGRGNIPVFYDGVTLETTMADYIAPWPYEEMLSLSRSSEQCINRHDGYVNYLFMDWSVRKVGLKELWILKWDPGFNTANPWTRAGGVKPEDWPEWMRKFKDY